MRSSFGERLILLILFLFFLASVLLPFAIVYALLPD